jgi:2-keto-3-deoxy-L-rhamnonate aldolase RhmA
MAYKKEANEQVVICVQIESPEAISNIEAIVGH